MSKIGGPAAPAWRQHGWLASVGFAVRGLGHAWRSQRNFRIETVCAVLAVGAALWLGVPLTPILLTCGLVLGLELVNTALEAVVDLVSPDPHPLAGVAKDVAAGAVLLASVVALAVAAVELLPALVARLGS